MERHTFRKEVCTQYVRVFCSREKAEIMTKNRKVMFYKNYMQSTGTIVCSIHIHTTYAYVVYAYAYTYV